MDDSDGLAQGEKVCISKHCSWEQMWVIPGKAGTKPNETGTQVGVLMIVLIRKEQALVLTA